MSKLTKRTIRCRQKNLLLHGPWLYYPIYLDLFQGRHDWNFFMDFNEKSLPISFKSDVHMLRIFFL